VHGAIKIVMNLLCGDAIQESSKVEFEEKLHNQILDELIPTLEQI
jgi:hypothetical protein